MEESQLKAVSLRKSYRKKEVVRGVSIEVGGGEIVGLLGPNGAGKTTTFSMIAGFVRPTEGKLELNAKDITGLEPHQRAKQGLVYLPQESSVFRKLTVEDNIRAIAETLKISHSEREELVKAHTLSGGERRRLEITRALVLNPRFLLLDEPFSGVDPKSVSEVNKIMINLKARGIGILLTDHNVRETLRVVDRAYLLYEGSVLAHGDAAFLISDPETRQKYLGDDFEN